ncbi:MAG: Gfo/Idh/MocA family protein [Anaerolineae bacterium]
MSESKLNVGIIGIGWWALTRHAPRLQEIPDAELVAIARRNPEALADAKEALGGGVEAYTDWHRLLDHPGLDAVIVSTPQYAHTEPTVGALERGFPVLLEKPMALESKDAWTMVEAAEATDSLLMIGYNLRCLGPWRTAARALRDGALGTVRQISTVVHYNTRWLWELEEMPEGIHKRLGLPESFLTESLEDYWRTDPSKMGGGQFADSGSHFVDLALWLGGAPATEVVALGASAGPPVETHLGIQARLANDVLVSFSSADGVPAGPYQLTVYGDAGTMTAAWIEMHGTPEITVHTAGGQQKLDVDIPDTTPTAAFVDTVLRGAPNLSPPRGAAHAVAFSEAVYRSVAEQAIVKIEPAQ